MNLVKTLKEDNWDNIFSKIAKLEKITNTSPMSTADEERKFSSMKTI